MKVSRLKTTSADHKEPPKSKPTPLKKIVDEILHRASIQSQIATFGTYTILNLISKYDNPASMDDGDIYGVIKITDSIGRALLNLNAIAEEANTLHKSRRRNELTPAALSRILEDYIPTAQDEYLRALEEKRKMENALELPAVIAQTIPSVHN